MMNSSCACNEMWERALMTTAAQLMGAQRHVAIISNGLFSRKCVWVRYQISAGRAFRKCAGLRDIGLSSLPETSRVLFPNRGVASDTGGGWPFCEHDRVSRRGD